MKKNSTLIFLIHKVHSTVTNTGLIPLDEPGVENVLGDIAPPERSVRAILDFARSYQVADTRLVGKVEWVLN